MSCWVLYLEAEQKKPPKNSNAELGHQYSSARGGGVWAGSQPADCPPPSGKGGSTFFLANLWMTYCIFQCCFNPFNHSGEAWFFLILKNTCQASASLWAGILDELLGVVLGGWPPSPSTADEGRNRRLTAKHGFDTRQRVCNGIKHLPAPPNMTQPSGLPEGSYMGGGGHIMGGGIRSL